MNTPISKFTIKLFVLTSLLVTTIYSIHAQCPVTAFANPLTIYCGDTAVLGALADGCKPLNNNFNTGTIGTDWSASPGGVVTDGTGTYACAGPPPEGSHYLWMGANIPAPRGVITNDYDLTQCGATSGTICFLMKYATQGGANPCEGIDLPAEGIYVQYSTNGGATWTTIQYYDPLGGYDPILTSWNNYCLTIPAAAFTANTRFRWYQNQSSGSGFDTWGLDDMVITLNSPGYTFDWAHDAQGPSSSANTPPVTPTTTTTYTVTYTNGVETCTSPVTVNVIAPTVTASASPITICSGESSQLIANSSLIATPPTTCGINSYVGCPPNSDAGEPQIGNGTTVANYNSGANYVFGDFGSTGGVRTQIIYRASELIAAGFSAGQITNMQLEVAAIQTGSSTTTGSALYKNFTIQLACISANAFTSSSNWYSGLTTVFPATNVNVTPGWNTFNFPNSYNWDGTSNIIVQLCWYNGSDGGNPAKTKTQPAGFNSMIASYVNASGATLNCASHTSFQSLYSFRPNTRFGTCTPRNVPLTYSWTPTTGLSDPNVYNPVATPSSTTTYTVTVQQVGAPAACAASDSVTINVIEPSVTITNVCSNGIATLTANGVTNGTVPSGTITNSNNSSQSNYNVNTYVEKCIDVSNINPNTYPAGLANVFINITHCDISEVDIQIMGPGGAWQPLTGLTSGGTNWTNLPAGAATSLNGQWCIRYKDNCVGCGPLGVNDCGGLNFNSWNISVNNTAGNNQIVEYTWSPATNLNTTTGSTVQSNSTSPITYTVTVKDAFGCTSSQSITVDASSCNQQPTASFTPSSTTICEGGSITFTDTSIGDNINNWNWTFNGGLPNSANTQGPHTVVFNSSGSFNITLQITDVNGTDDTTITITVNPTPTVIASNDTAICNGSSATISASGASSYAWDNGIGAGQSHTVSPTTTTTYMVTGTDANGCQNTDSVIITVNPVPTVLASNDTTICNGSSAIISASGASSYSWDNGLGNGQSHTVSPTTTTTYMVTGTNANGCQNTDSVIITVNPAPTVTASNDTAICNGSSAIISASGASSYSWDNGLGNGQSHTVSPTTTTTYMVTGTNANGCQNTDSVIITVNPAPTVVASNDTAICNGSSTTISASGASSYTWDNSLGNGQSHTVSPTTTTTYVVTGTDANSCQNTDTVIITVNPLPIIDSIPFTNESACGANDGSITIYASGSGLTYSIDGGATFVGSNSFTALPAGSYNIVVQSADGCLANGGVISISSAGAPAAPPASASPNPACEGDSLTLAVTNPVAGESYNWSGPNAFTATGQTVGIANITPAMSGAYTVTASVGSCVSPGTTINVTINPNDVIVLSSPAGSDNQSICLNEAITTISYSVSGGGTGATASGLPTGVTGSFAGGVFTITGTPTVVGSFNYAVITSGVCTPDTALGNITVNPAPTVVANASATSICSGDSVTLSGSGASSYSWNNGVTDGVAFNPTATATYTVVGTDANGCQNTDSITVTVTNCNQPVASFTASALSVCQGDSITFTDNSTGSSITNWNWSFSGGSPNSANTQGPHTVVFNNAGSFNITLQVTDANGIDDTTIIVTVNPTPSLNINVTNVTCNGACDGTANVVVNGGTAPYTYFWSSGGNTNTETGLCPNLYDVMVTDALGCWATENTTLNEPPLLQITLISSDNPLCNNSCDGNITVNGNGGSGGYQFSIDGINFQSSGTFSNLCSGNYTVTIKDTNSCSQTLNVVLSDPTPISVNMISTTDVSCNTLNNGNSNDGSIQINANGGTAPLSYSIDNGNNNSTTNIFSGLSNGTYSIVVTDANGCSVNAGNAVINEPIAISIPNVITDASCYGSNDGQIVIAPQGGSPNYSYTWSTGNGNTPIATNLSAGQVTVTVTDNNGCSQDSLFIVNQPPQINFIAFDASILSGCAPLKVEFYNLTDTNLTSNILWDLGNGISSTLDTVSTIFTSPGSYTVSLTVTDKNGCTGTHIETAYINVFENPKADFSSSPNNATLFDPTIYFTDLSQYGIVSWEWNFGGMGQSSIQHPNFTFPSDDTANYLISLIVENSYGCKDTISRIINVEGEFGVFIPTAFTPDSDNLNEFFAPKGFGITDENYSLLIYNRWGELIFESNLLENGWDGYYKNTLVEVGVYVWKLNFQDINGKKQQKTGKVTILR